MASQNALWPSPHGWHHQAGPNLSISSTSIHHTAGFKDNIVFASLPVESPRGTITSSHGNSYQSATKLWDPMIVFSTEEEPRALHTQTRKALPLNYILSLKLQISNEWETVTINKDRYVTSSKQRITYQNEEFLIGKGTIQFSVLLTTQGKKRKTQYFFSKCSGTGFQTLPRAPKT